MRLLMPSRRSLLKTAAATTALALPALRGVRAAERLVVRTPGGAFDDVKRKYVYEPFQKETGIEVVPYAATAAKLLAMSRAGDSGLDCIDTGDDVLLQLEQAGALAPIPYDKFSRTDPQDIDPDVKRSHQVGSFVYAMLMGFNTTVYAVGKEPKSWEEFWDLKKYPGTRTLAGMASGAPNLEFALIADGVPMHKLYPLDIDRAFRSLSRIRSAVPKFWDTGALSTEMLSSKEAVLGALWSTRVQVAADGGAPLAAQWNQNEILAQAYGIPKTSKNMEAAAKFIDYSLSPAVQQRWLRAYKAIPVNKKAYGDLAPELVDPATKLPWTKSKGFRQDIDWWAANRGKVNSAWSQWVLG